MWLVSFHVIALLETDARVWVQGCCRGRMAMCTCPFTWVLVRLSTKPLLQCYLRSRYWCTLVGTGVDKTTLCSMEYFCFWPWKGKKGKQIKPDLGAREAIWGKNISKSSMCKDHVVKACSFRGKNPFILIVTHILPPDWSIYISLGNIFASCYWMMRFQIT